MPISRLSPSGVPGCAYGPFSNKVEQVVTPEVEAESFTGGWGTAWQNYRDDEATRRQRVAMGIIPDDEPEKAAILEAAQQSLDVLARRKIRALERKSEELDRIEALTLRLMKAQREAEREAQAAMIANLKAERVEAQGNLTQIQRNQNAQATLVMLALL